MSLLRRLAQHAQRPDWRLWLARLEQLPAWKLFLGALLLGLLLGLPWQCARQMGANKTSLPEAAPESITGAEAQLPNSRNPGRAQSILGMPSPSIEAETGQQPTENPASPGAPENTASLAASALPEVPTQVDASAAVAVHAPAPEYPANALRSREEGTVLVRVDIDTSGLPVRVEVDRSSRSRALDRAALEAVGQWRFKPAMAQGIAVESSLVVPISFKAGQDQ